MSIELTFEKKPALKDKKGSEYFSVGEATEIQIKELILSGSVLKDKVDGSLPFYIEAISDAPFCVKTDLSGILAVLSIFKEQRVSVTSGSNTKPLTAQDLTNFIFS